MEKFKILDSDSQNFRSYSALKFGCHAPFLGFHFWLAYLKACAAYIFRGFELKFVLWIKDRFNFHFIFILVGIFSSN